MPRVNPTNRSLDDLTVGELRAVIAAGEENVTITDALAVIAEANRRGAEHEADVRQYNNAYVDRRNARHAAALAEAAAAADQDEARRRTGDGARMAARQSARAETAEAFDRANPLLEFAAWIDLGRPDVHTVGAVRRAVKAVTAGMAH